MLSLCPPRQAIYAQSLVEEFFTTRQWRRQGGGRRESSPYGWTSKNMQYVCAFIVMELLRIARQIHCRAVEQRATLIHRQYDRSVVTPLAEMDTGSSV